MQDLFMSYVPCILFRSALGGLRVVMQSCLVSTPVCVSIALGCCLRVELMMLSIEVSRWEA